MVRHSLRKLPSFFVLVSCLVFFSVCSKVVILLVVGVEGVATLPIGVAAMHAIPFIASCAGVVLFHIPSYPFRPDHHPFGAQVRWQTLT